MKPSTLLTILLLFTLLTGCWRFVSDRYLDIYGPEAHPTRVIETAEAPFPDYHSHVKPIIDSRCVVCHACYDAPCQLKMESFEGIDRGASKELVYNGARLTASEPSRLGIDVKTTDEWRSRDFFPVLNERNQTPEANLEASLLYRVLDLKRQHPLPIDKPLPKSIDIAPTQRLRCSTLNEFDDFAADNPLGGMPWGLPAINDREFQTLKIWLRDGARFNLASVPVISEHEQKRVDRWEAWFNGSSDKNKLVSRYLYEHLFLAHLYLNIDEQHTGNRQFYRLVRSRTAPGQTIDEIATRRPFDDPGIDPFFYRLKPVNSTIVAKQHLPYRLDNARMERWDSLFYVPDYTLSHLPDYQPDNSRNPFKVFSDLPVSSRYHFLLDEAEFSIANFIKGPVCRGQIALNVINDHFWVMFVNPDANLSDNADELLAENSDYLRLPGEAGSNALILSNWLKYSHKQRVFTREKSKWLNQILEDKGPLNLDIIWDGNGDNRNAALTVFRHFDSAAVTKGWIGKTPKTGWLIDYTALERIHYLLVADYDVFGNIGHQLTTRLYMDFLRMESEYNFTLLLPRKDAEREIKLWYRDDKNTYNRYMKFASQQHHGETSAIGYRTKDPKAELFSLAAEHFGPSVLSPDPINRPAKSAQGDADALQRIANISGAQLNHFPEASLLLVESSQGSRIYSLIRNRAHSNISSIFGEENRLIDDEQTLTVTEGVIGSYPNRLFRVAEENLDAFASALEQSMNTEDFKRLNQHFLVERSHPDFWAYSDKLHANYTSSDPVNAGWLDFNRLEGR